MDPRKHLDKNEEQRQGYLDWLRKDLGDDFVKIEPLLPMLEQFSVSGLVSVGNFLSKAHDQSKLEQAIARVDKGCQEHWFFQHPNIRGNPNFGSNGVYMDLCFLDIGLQKVDNTIETRIPEVADNHYLLLRARLEVGPKPDDEPVDYIALTDQKRGQLVILETESGNRYLLEVVDPAARIINLLVLKKRTGFASDGYYPNIESRNPRLGHQLSTSAVTTSPLEAIYLA